MLRKIFTILLAPILFFQALPAHAETDEGRTWEDEIIYSLLVDRFNNGDNSNDFDRDTNNPTSYHGGDFKGIIDQLDYLKDMGFTAIQVSPIFANEAGGYHGEWVTDFYAVNEHFGTMDEFNKMIAEAHGKGMKVILEFGSGLVGASHPWAGDPDKKDWVLPLQGQKQYKLNYGNAEVQAYIREAASWWIDETDVDGLHFTVGKDDPQNVWTDLAAGLKKDHDAIFLSGMMESFDGPAAAKLMDAGFDSVADGKMNDALREVFVKPGQVFKPMFDAWEDNVKDYAKPGMLSAYFDNKTMHRYTKEMTDDKQFPGSRWKLALTYLYTQPEIPFVYYGTEIAVNGGEPPDNQALMNFRADKELIDYIKRLGELRKEHKPLSRGDVKVLYDQGGMTVFARTYKEATVVVAINNTVEDQSVTIPAEELKDDMELRGIFGTDLVRSENGEYKIFTDRETAEVYKLTDKSGYNIPFIAAMIGVFVVFILFMFIVWKRGKKRNPYQN